MADLFDAASHEFALLHDHAPRAAIDEAAEVLEWASKSKQPHQIYATGVGKSGIAAMKFAATLAAHGVPAQFIDPVEALHGGMGRIAQFDRVVAFSASGATKELSALAVARAQPFDVGVYGPQSWTDLHAVTSYIVPTGVGPDRDAPTNYVPGLSFLAQVLVSDALALEVARLNGADGLKNTHPGGNLGATKPWS